MTLTEQKVAAKKFAQKWANRGDEKQDTRSFWEEFMEDVLGIEGARDIIYTEYPVDINGHQKYIDVYYKEQEILIEQKSADKALNKRYRQSGGDMLTPFEQGRRYAGYLPYGINARWIIACNFQQFEIHDLKKPGDAPVIVELGDLSKDIGLFRFFVSDKDEDIKRETEISKDAGIVVGRLYDALLTKYVDPTNTESQRHLNILVTRLVFCMYAEDAGLFGDNTNRFRDYVNSKNPEDLGDALERLFRILDTPYEIRSKKSNISNTLSSFPYVNGGLFAEEEIEIPLFDESLKKTLVEDACAFNWAEISPTIFGAVFESTLNPETRRSDGMHYTSIENIHKVIDPLFLEELKEEFRAIQATADLRGYKNRLIKFQEKLASYKFLDPACGSGNFLTESYLSLRRLENQAIAERFGGQQAFGEVFEENPIHVSIDQFFGIEINDFAVTVSRTALWIAEAQMLEETEEIIRSQIEFFPLKTNAYIVEGNALQLDWSEAFSGTEFNYIMGNPPFVGGMMMSSDKKDDMKSVIGDDASSVGEMDYVVAWYYKAAAFIQDTRIECCFVSTNSIVQGQQAITVWEPLFKKYGIIINFAYRTFKWTSEANDKAAVHCVIIGFSLFSHATKYIFDEDGNYEQVSRINSYLMDAEDWFIHPVSKPLCSVPPIKFGSMPRGKAFIMSSEERSAIVQAYPFADPYIKRFYMGNEFINGGVRYCLWLLDADPSIINNCPPIKKRIEEIKKSRLASKAKATQKLAESPTLFAQIAQPDTDYIAVPAVSTQRRRYIPLGFLSKDVIAGNKLYIIPSAGIYHFGILTSNVHMAWMRMFAGRLKSDYSYSKDIVYNNFPWPRLDATQKEAIIKTAQRILDVRRTYANASLSDLYDEVSMPLELRKAHQANDMAVMEAYGFYQIDANGKKHWYTEEETVAALMKMYQKLTQPEKTATPKKPKATVKVKVHRKQ